MKHSTYAYFIEYKLNIAFSHVCCTNIIFYLCLINKNGNILTHSQRGTGLRTLRSLCFRASVAFVLILYALRPHGQGCQSSRHSLFFQVNPVHPAFYSSFTPEPPSGASLLLLGEISCALLSVHMFWLQIFSGLIYLKMSLLCLYF